MLDIILADDDPDDCLFFSEALSKVMNEANLTICRNGLELIEYLEENQRTPDIIFLDINMPRKDGVACLAEIRKKEAYNLVPIVMFTTSNNHVFIDHTYKKGANLYITKPNNTSQLEKILQHVFNLPWEEYMPNPPMPPLQKYVLKVAG